MTEKLLKQAIKVKMQPTTKHRDDNWLLVFWGNNGIIFLLGYVSHSEACKEKKRYEKIIKSNVSLNS